MKTKILEWFDHKYGVYRKMEQLVTDKELKEMPVIFDCKEQDGSTRQVKVTTVYLLPPIEDGKDE